MKDKIIINITESTSENTKISCECLPVVALEMIKLIAEDYDVEVFVNAEQMSIASLIALSKTQFIYPDNN